MCGAWLGCSQAEFFLVVSNSSMQRGSGFVLLIEKLLEGNLLPVQDTALFWLIASFMLRIGYYDSTSK